MFSYLVVVFCILQLIINQGVVLHLGIDSVKADGAPAGGGYHTHHGCAAPLGALGGIVDLTQPTDGTFFSADIELLGQPKPSLLVVGLQHHHIDTYRVAEFEATQLCHLQILLFSIMPVEVALGRRTLPEAARQEEQGQQQ